MNKKIGIIIVVVVVACVIGGIFLYISLSRDKSFDEYERNPVELEFSDSDTSWYKTGSIEEQLPPFTKYELADMSVVNTDELSLPDWLLDELALYPDDAKTDVLVYVTLGLTDVDEFGKSSSTPYYDYADYQEMCFSINGEDTVIVLGNDVMYTYKLSDEVR